MATDLLIHGTGLIALLLNVLALCRSCERSLRIQSGLSGVAWAANNLLLGANTAAALTLVSASRTATSAVLLQRSARLRAFGFGCFSLVTLAVGLSAWDGWSSAMVTGATLLSTYAMFYMRGRSLRWIMIAVSNFVLPGYFTRGEAEGRANDFLGRRHEDLSLHSFGLAPGGYICFYDSLRNGDKWHPFTRPDDDVARKRLDVKQTAGQGRIGRRREKR